MYYIIIQTHTLKLKKNGFSNPSVSSKFIRRTWANDTETCNLCLSFLTK